MNTLTNNGLQNVSIQEVTPETIRLLVDNVLMEIGNQFAEWKSFCQDHNVQNVQYAEKIYNIEHINEANFGYVTDKKAFNETLTKQLIEYIKPFSLSARNFLEKATVIPNWESQLRVSDKAKEIIAYSFVGVIGIQFSKLMAIGKEDFSESKQRKYIEKCLHIAQRSLDLVCFALISKWWDAQKQQRPLPDKLQSVLSQRFDGTFELSIVEQFQLLQGLHGFFSAKENTLAFPMQELGEKDFAACMSEGSDFHKACQRLQSLGEKLDKAQHNLLDCFEAETQLAAFFSHFHFLVNYRMASIKHIGFRQIRNTDPHYLHRYAALGIDSKAQQDAEKINYTTCTVNTDAVLLYRGDNYQENINLFPFVIDYNALTLEQGAKICFYRSKEIADGSLEYLFLEDNSVVQLEKKGILKSATNLNELMMSNDNRKTINLDSVVEQFCEARRCLVGEVPNFDDL